MFSAILDTCVLWPSLQRDFLLSMAIEGLYRPLWSEAILAELCRSEEIKLSNCGYDESAAIEKSNRLVDRMRTAFDDALVTGWEGLEGSFGLPDPDDEHVVAAAVVGGAGAIITNNLKHFPTSRMPRSIQVLTGRDFAANTADIDPARAAQALRTISRRSTRPKRTPEELLELLVFQYQMDDVADILRPLLAAIPPPGDRETH